VAIAIPEHHSFHRPRYASRDLMSLIVPADVICGQSYQYYQDLSSNFLLQVNLKLCARHYPHKVNGDCELITAVFRSLPKFSGLPPGSKSLWNNSKIPWQCGQHWCQIWSLRVSISLRNACLNQASCFRLGSPAWTTFIHPSLATIPPHIQVKISCVQHRPWNWYLTELRICRQREYNWIMPSPWVDMTSFYEVRHCRRPNSSVPVYWIYVTLCFALHWRTFPPVTP
jgi:hypothetical protein